MLEKIDEERAREILEAKVQTLMDPEAFQIRDKCLRGIMNYVEGCIYLNLIRADQVADSNVPQELTGYKSEKALEIDEVGAASSESLSAHVDFVQSVMEKQDTILLKFDSEHHPFCRNVLERTSLLADPTSCREVPNNIELNIIQYAKGIMDILQLKVYRLCAILVMNTKQQFLESIRPKSTKINTPALTLPKSIKAACTPNIFKQLSSSNDKLDILKKPISKSTDSEIVSSGSPIMERTQLNLVAYDEQIMKSSDSEKQFRSIPSESSSSKAQKYLPTFIPIKSEPEQPPIKSAVSLGQTPTISNPEAVPIIRKKINELEKSKPWSDTNLDFSKKRKFDEPIIISDSDDEKKVARQLDFIDSFPDRSSKLTSVNPWAKAISDHDFDKKRKYEEPILMSVSNDNKERIQQSAAVSLSNGFVVDDQTTNLKKLLSEEIKLNDNEKLPGNFKNSNNDKNGSEYFLFGKRPVSRQDDYISKLQNIVADMPNLYPKKKSNSRLYQNPITSLPQEALPISSSGSASFDFSKAKEDKIMHSDTFTSEVFIPLVDPASVNESTFIAPRSTEKVLKSQLARNLAFRPKQPVNPIPKNPVGVSSLNNSVSPVGSSTFGKESIGSLGLFEMNFSAKSSEHSLNIPSKEIVGLDGSSKSLASFAKSNIEDDLRDPVKMKASVLEDTFQSAHFCPSKPKNMVSSSKASLAPSQKSRITETPLKAPSLTQLYTHKPSIDPSELVDNVPGLADVFKDNHNEKKDLYDKRFFREKEDHLLERGVTTTIRETASTQSKIISPTIRKYTVEEPESDTSELRYQEPATVETIRTQNQEEKAEYLRQLADSITNLQNTRYPSSSIFRNHQTFDSTRTGFYPQTTAVISPQNNSFNQSPPEFARDIQVQQSQVEQYSNPQLSTFRYSKSAASQDGSILNVPPHNQAQTPTNYIPQRRPRYQ